MDITSINRPVDYEAVDIHWNTWGMNILNLTDKYAMLGLIDVSQPGTDKVYIFSGSHRYHVGIRHIRKAIWQSRNPGEEFHGDWSQTGVSDADVLADPMAGWKVKLYSTGMLI